MTYDELIKDLRENHDKYFARDMEAADAIEDLITVLTASNEVIAKTNADRFRSMSDEELAEWLEAHCYQYGWLDWLRQEAKDGSV